MGEGWGREGACCAQGGGAGNCGGGDWSFGGEGNLRFQNFKFQMEGERQRQKQKATADPLTATRAIASWVAGTHSSRFAMEERLRASSLGMVGWVGAGE